MKNKKRLLTSAVIVLMLIICAGIVVGCTTGHEPQISQPEDPYKDVEKHSYMWKYITDADGTKEYSDPNGIIGEKTIDVSSHNGYIRWDEVASDNVKYAFIRGGYRGYQSGKIVEDDFFLYNLREAKKAGIETGVYFFSQAITQEEAAEEAAFIVGKIKDMGVTLPIVFDMEDVAETDHRAKNLSVSQRTEIAVAFCEEVKRQGYSPMIYGNETWLTEKYDLRQISKYPIWFAGYSNYPKFPYRFEMWQYTHRGKVKGIDTVADLNLWFKSK